jgi:hypothetical protein
MKQWEYARFYLLLGGYLMLAVLFGYIEVLAAQELFVSGGHRFSGYEVILSIAGLAVIPAVIAINIIVFAMKPWGYAWFYLFLSGYFMIEGLSSVIIETEQNLSWDTGLVADMFMQVDMFLIPWSFALFFLNLGFAAHYCVFSIRGKSFISKETAIYFLAFMCYSILGGCYFVTLGNGT